MYFGFKPPGLRFTAGFGALFFWGSVFTVLGLGISMEQV